MASAVAHAHDVHTHDEPNEHDHETFITGYSVSTDHNMIAKQYLVTGILWAFVGGLLSIRFRLNLGFAEMDYTWLKPV